MVVCLLWLSGRALTVQARSVLGSTPGSCRPSSLFLYLRLITFTNSFTSSLRQDVLSIRFNVFDLGELPIVANCFFSLANSILLSPNYLSVSTFFAILNIV